MNYNKEKFLIILDKIKASFGSQNKMADALELSSSYITKIYDENTKNPPAPEYLRKIADNSRGITTYQELMEICGYSVESLETKVLIIYKNLKEFHKYINNGKSDNDNFYQITSFVEDFQSYISLLEKNLALPTITPILLVNIFKKEHMLEDYQYVAGFLMLYDSLLKYLEKEDYIAIVKSINIDYFNIESIYDNISNFEYMELFSYSNKYITIKNPKNMKLLIESVKNFSTCLNLAYLSDFDNNALTELFKKKALKNNENEIIDDSSLVNSNKLDTEGLDDNDIEEVRKFIEFLKTKKTI